MALSKEMKFFKYLLMWDTVFYILIALVVGFAVWVVRADPYDCTFASTSFVCSKAGTSPPPITVTPPPTTGCSFPAEMRTLSNMGASALHKGTQGTPYAYKLPSSLQGHGFLQQADNPSTPTEMTVEWAIAKCPGDFDYYKTDIAKVPTGRGALYPACGGVNGAVGAQYSWGPAANPKSYQECRVPPGEQWYISVRYVNGCNIPDGCVVSYYHNEY